MAHPTRRTLMLAGLAAAGGLLGACANAPAPKKAREYTESISSVLVSQDHKHMVVVGHNHHYVFELPEVLARALQSPAHGQLSASFSPFHVDAHGDISGEVTLAAPVGATPELAQAAAGIGLEAQADGSWRSTIRLQGHRYASWGYKQPGQTRESLGQARTIVVTTDEKLDDAVADAAVTPVRLAADGMHLIYFVALAPIVIPIIFATRARDH